MILPESLHCYCLHLLRVSVSEVLQVYFTPDEFNPVAPAGAQNAPGEIGDCEAVGLGVGIAFGVGLLGSI